MQGLVSPQHIKQKSCCAMPCQVFGVVSTTFLAGRSLCLWDYKAVKGVTKRSCPFVQHFQRYKPSVEHCLPSDPPSSSTTKVSNPAVSLHHELAIKELTKLWWVMVSFLCEQNQLSFESEGLNHSYNACGTGFMFMGTAGAWWNNTVFAGVRRRKWCHLSLGTAKPACWIQNRQMVWFGTVWDSGFAIRSWELVIIFVCEPVLQTSQVLFCFAQIRETSVLIKRHVTMLKWKWWFCSNHLSLFFKHFTLNCRFDIFSPWFNWKSQGNCYLCHEPLWVDIFQPMEEEVL